jgi:hypothetical protein
MDRSAIAIPGDRNIGIASRLETDAHCMTRIAQPNNSERNHIMCAKRSDGFGRRISFNAAACALALGALSPHCGTASAQQSSVSPRPLQARAGVLRVADLEKAFWMCDYAATTRGVHATPVDVCSALTDDFKNARFGGDFEQMLRWWQKNKLAEHQKLVSRAR